MNMNNLNSKKENIQYNARNLISLFKNHLVIFKNKSLNKLNEMNEKLKDFYKIRMNDIKILIE